MGTKKLYAPSWRYKSFVLPCIDGGEQRIVAVFLGKEAIGGKTASSQAEAEELKKDIDQRFNANGFVEVSE